MKKIAKIISAVAALVFIPGLLMVLFLWLLARMLGFKINMDKLKAKIWKKE
jgi:hypothetical protein